MCAKPISADKEPVSAGEAGRWFRACGIAALSDRAILPVRVAGHHLLLVQAEGALHATERACPHEGADLALGRCAAGRLHCPRHQAWFALADGSVSPGWNFRRLRTFPTRRIGASVEIWIEAPAGEVSLDPLGRARGC